MRTAFLADIHSNLEALLSIINSLKNNNIDKVILLGDIVGYGADPNECIRIIREISDIVIAGNHDWACAGKDTIESFNPSAKDAAQWTRKVLTDQSRDFLLSLPLKKKPMMLFLFTQPHISLKAGNILHPPQEQHTVLTAFLNSFAS